MQNCNPSLLECIWPCRGGRGMVGRQGGRSVEERASGAARKGSKGDGSSRADAGRERSSASARQEIAGGERSRAAVAVESGAPPLEEEWDVRGVLHPSPSRRESSSPLSSGSLAEGAGEVPPLAYGRGEADWKGRASPWLASGGRARRGCGPGVASPATLPCPDRRRRLKHGAWRRCWH
jgi:hypothetical protein